MVAFAEYTDLQRATERLYGILAGIAIDYRINDNEIGRLYDWMQTHRHLNQVEPFTSVFSMINRALADSVVDNDEREEILEWCAEFSQNIPDCVTTAIRRLHGVLQGIAIDDMVLESEAISLKDWLNDYGLFKTHWPFSATWEILEKIFQDGVIKEDEKTELIEYCRQFSEERIKSPIIHDEDYFRPWMSTRAHVLQPFTALCDRLSTIAFEDHLFCFTGPAKTGPRKVLHKMVTDHGGKCSKNIIKELNYLVIGAQSSPCWAYSTYGRKIEAAIKYRDAGESIIILHEDDFIKQATAEVKASRRLSIIQ